MFNFKSDVLVPPLNSTLIEYEFDEEDDLLLPDTIWGEIQLILYMINYIITHPTERKKEIFNLKRQVKIYIRWLKIR